MKKLSKEKEWQHVLLTVVSGLLLFETLSGLAIWVVPFSVPTQVTVLVHTGIGLVFLIPYLWYQIRHWSIYRGMKLTHIKLTGYLAMAGTVVAIVTGIVLSWQAVFTTRISYWWDTAHIVSTFAILASALPHVLIIVFRDHKARAVAAIRPILQAERKYGAGLAYTSLMLAALVAAGVYAYRAPLLNNELPSDYNYLYGSDRPFAPSLAMTSTGKAIDARVLGASQSCGRSGCHTQIVQEWEVSAHRWAASDPSFRAIQTVMGEQNGPESTRYCGGCHDPISLFSGSKNLFRAELTNPMGLDEGISCVSCHAISETDIKGNANYTIRQPERYLFEIGDDEKLKGISDFLIRAIPKQHVESLQHRRFKSPEFCAACHKQFIDEDINKVGWVQLQNQYDNWRKSRWNHPGDPTKTIECRECHMPLVASFDPASGDDLDYNRSAGDGKHRSHRFLGANQYIPAVMSLKGADEQVRLTEEWLKGNIDIPEIKDKWREGPAIPVEVHAPEHVAPGEQVTVEVTITNNKTGHDFPTGPLDIIQSWLHLVVTDQDGNEVFASGDLDQRGFIEPGAFMFKAEPVDQYGKLIDKHNLWDMVGVRYKRSLFPGFSDKAEFTFGCPVSVRSAADALPGRQQFRFDAPAGTVTKLNVKATLFYRKINQFLLNQMFGEKVGQTAALTALSSDTKTIPVVSISSRKAPASLAALPH